MGVYQIEESLAVIICKMLNLSWTCFWGEIRAILQAYWAILKIIFVSQNDRFLFRNQLGAIFFYFSVCQSEIQTLKMHV